LPKGFDLISKEKRNLESVRGEKRIEIKGKK
jgi:hypothetical protein